MFEWMEIVDQVYEGVTPSKTTDRADTNHDVHTRKRKRGGSTLQTKLKKGCPGKHKKNMQAI